MKKKKIYLHYGASKFDPNHSLGGGHMGKPNGFWASPKHSDLGWRQYCEDNFFHIKTLEKCISFTLKKESRILNIRCLEDVLPYLKEKEEYNDHGFRQFDRTDGMELDMEKLHANFDGMEVFLSKNWGLRDFFLFYVYDVDSIVIWNLDIVEINTNNKRRKFK